MKWFYEDKTGKEPRWGFWITNIIALVGVIVAILTYCNPNSSTKSSSETLQNSSTERKLSLSIFDANQLSVLLESANPVDSNIAVEPRIFPEIVEALDYLIIAGFDKDDPNIKDKDANTVLGLYKPKTDTFDASAPDNSSYRYPCTFSTPVFLNDKLYVGFTGPTGGLRIFDLASRSELTTIWGDKRDKFGDYVYKINKYGNNLILRSDKGIFMVDESLEIIGSPVSNTQDTSSGIKEQDIAIAGDNLVYLDNQTSPGKYFLHVLDLKSWSDKNTGYSFDGSKNYFSGFSVFENNNQVAFCVSENLIIYDIAKNKEVSINLNFAYNDNKEFQEKYNQPAIKDDRVYITGFEKDLIIVTDVTNNTNKPLLFKIYESPSAPLAFDDEIFINTTKNFRVYDLNGENLKIVDDGLYTKFSGKKLSGSKFSRIKPFARKCNGKVEVYFYGYDIISEIKLP